MTSSTLRAYIDGYGMTSRYEVTDRDAALADLQRDYEVRARCGFLYAANGTRCVGSYQWTWERVTV